ncbi:uncharacterized protein LOC130738418 [Lotus japonicus]|uniref:uncharacterized protein LOC130738418 n=1 Tax=Lotus japonicus TaxID=34305 RepID=UPI002583484C|nr:uncharacterized protein LOC130738418 [Lotus japonicus]
MLRSQDYHSHISQVSRSPSVLTDVPQYPNAHLAFNKRTIYEEECERSPGLHHRHHNPETRERVEVMEYEQVPKVGAGEVIYEENVVDYETDNYRPIRNRGGLELHKWKTYRP